jgi:hypothetical protein
MNMFRNLLILFLLVLGFGLIFGDPDHWTWLDRLGPTAVNVLKVCIQFKPFVVGACFIVSLALFMTKKIY